MKVRFLDVGVTGSSISAHIKTHARARAHTHTQTHMPAWARGTLNDLKISCKVGTREELFSDQTVISVQVRSWKD